MKAQISYKQAKRVICELLWDEALPVTLTLTIVAEVCKVGSDLIFPHGVIRVIGVIDLVLFDLLACAHVMLPCFQTIALHNNPKAS